VGGEHRKKNQAAPQLRGQSSKGLLGKHQKSSRKKRDIPPGAKQVEKNLVATIRGGVPRPFSNLPTNDVEKKIQKEDKLFGKQGKQKKQRAKG